MTFGFRFEPEEQKRLRAWREPYMKAVREAIESNELETSMLGAFWSYEFVPVDDDEWRYKTNLPTSIKIEPLIITGGIEAVDDDDPKDVSLKDDEYATLLRHGWTLATARQYSYHFMPTGLGTAVDCRKLTTGEIIDLTDVSNW